MKVIEEIIKIIVLIGVGSAALILTLLLGVIVWFIVGEIVNSRRRNLLNRRPSNRNQDT